MRVIPERKLFVEAVAAEVAHDLMAPLNYFRMLVERSARGETPDREDLEIAAQEITRLEALLGTLKRLAANRLARAPLSLAELVTRFDAPAWRKLEIAIDPGVRLSCDGPRLGIALEALAENALYAAGESGAAGIEWTGASLVVWDTGPGLRESPAFAVTNDPERAGLGLTVARRTVRAHGWKLELERRADRTSAAILVRPEDILT